MARRRRKLVRNIPDAYSIAAPGSRNLRQLRLLASFALLLPGSVICLAAFLIKPSPELDSRFVEYFLISVAPLLLLFAMRLQGMRFSLWSMLAAQATSGMLLTMVALRL